MSLEENNNNNKQQPQKVTALQDLIAGGIAGSASVIVGHPFDTYKVRLQTSPNNKSVATNPAAFGGISSLFRGMGPPLSTAAVVNALIFSAYGESSRLWDVYLDGNRDRKEQDDGSSSSSHPLQKAFVCGSFAGAMQALVICPSEHIKCRLQIQHGVGCKDHIFKGPFDALDKIVTSQGITGLYRGFMCTAWREVPAFGMYFATYDYVRDTVTNLLTTPSSSSSSSSSSSTMDMNYDSTTDPLSSIEKNSSLEWAASALAGGFSGALTWALIYPFDVVKTRIQTAPLTTPLEKRRIMYMFRSIYKEHGIQYFFRGLGVTLLRAFPVNAIIFPVYEFILFELSQRGIGAFQTGNALLESGV